MVETIDGLFAKLATVMNNNTECEVLFAQLKTSIDDYQLIDETMYYLYSARYFRAKANHLHSLGKQEDAAKQEQLALRFQLKYEQQQPPNLRPNPSPIKPTSSNDEIEEKQVVLDAFELLKNDVKDDIRTADMNDIVAKLRQTINQLLSFESCQSLDDYLHLQTLADSIQRSSRLLYDPLSDPVGEYLGRIDTFNIGIRQYLYKRRVAFAQYLLANPEALFANVPLLQRNLETHTRRLAALFHTDKALGDEDQSLFQQLFVLIYSQKETLLSKLNISTRKSEAVEQFKKQGLEWWQKAVDISRARKDLWTEIKYLDASSLRNYTDNELAILQSEYACQSYEHYRLACHTLSDDGDLNEQIELRRFMSLALHLADKIKFRLESQLYAIAAIHLLVEHVPDFSLTKFAELQQLVVKIQGGSTTSPTTTDQSVPSPPMSCLALVPVNPTTRNALHAKRDIRVALIDDKRQLLLRQCLLRGNNLRINTAEEYILEAKSQATRSLVSGITVAIGGAGVTSGIGVKIYADVMTGFAAGSLVGPIGSIIGASVGLVSGGYMGYLLFKKSTELIEEPLVREELNQILGDACKSYLANDIDCFFKILAQNYACYKKRLVRIFLVEDHVEIKIDAEFIVHELLSHEFRPDGVAYLLVLIGEGLLRGPTLKAEGHENKLDPQTANVEAQKLFREVYSNASLQERAHFLDSKVAQTKLEDRSRLVNKLFQRFNRSVYSIPKEYFDDAITTPFTTRLSELSQIARLNYAMTHLFEADQENLKRSHHAIQRLKLDLTKTKSQHFFQLPEFRIKAIEDLLAAFGFFEEKTHNLAIETRRLLSIENPTPIELIDKVLVKDNSVARCERCIVVSEPTQTLTILADLLATSKLCRSQQFKLKALSNETLCVRNLPAIADDYQINFQLCQIQSHPEHGRVFVPKNKKITCRHSTDTPCIYIVLDDEEESIIGMFAMAEPEINYLLQKLNATVSNTDRFSLNIEIAEIYRERADKADAQHHLLALPLWLDALQYYTAARQLSDSSVATFGLLQCMIKLGRYARAENTLRELLLTSMKSSGEAWYLRAVACRKQGKFEDAHHAAREALRFNYVDAQKELKLCEKLKDETISRRMKVYERMVISNSAINQIDSSYNILSIDGGGVRGIIPALWLCELERHTKRCCSSLFQMMAGTSTGAIITTGLATPVSSTCKEPRYKAFDILQLYRTKTPSVFTPSSGILDRLGASIGKSARYMDTGRSQLFRQYYGDTCLSDLLVDSVIPAVTGQSNGTRLFTNLRSTRTYVPNYKIHDVLMCTSAAPTYFPPYMLDSILYVDGGVQANNPSMEALGQALDSNVSQDKIFVLSLGTGDYVPDPLHPNASRNLLFWAANSDTVTKAIFDGPQNNIDLSISRLLGETRYHRWQVWLEKPIALDDTDDQTLDMLCDLAREHFEAMDALDNRKRLGLLIEHLKSTN